MILADGTLTYRKNLMLFAKLCDIPRKERVQSSLAFMGLEDAADKLVLEYSGGTIRRLEIDQSTLHRPQVLFLDEPTGDLDPNGCHMVWDHTQELRRNFGMTILLTTHMNERSQQPVRPGGDHAPRQGWSQRARRKS